MKPSLDELTGLAGPLLLGSARDGDPLRLPHIRARKQMGSGGVPLITAAHPFGVHLTSDVHRRVADIIDCVEQLTRPRRYSFPEIHSFNAGGDPRGPAGNRATARHVYRAMSSPPKGRPNICMCGITKSCLAGRVGHGRDSGVWTYEKRGAGKKSGSGGDGTNLIIDSLR